MGGWGSVVGGKAVDTV